MKKLNKGLIGLYLILFMSVSVAEDWPNWRGPRNNGVSAETGLATQWSQTENINWRFPLPGPGPSTPITAGERIFLTSADGDNLVLLCVATSGKLRWQRIVTAGNKNIRQGESNLAASSPSADGRRVWAFFGNGELACFNFDGKRVWQFNVQDRYKHFRIYWGMASTPLLDGERLYLLILTTNQQFVVALDKNTGEEIWLQKRKTNASSESLHSYTSPIIYRFDGQEFLVTHGADYVVAHRLQDGGEIWRCGGLQKSMYNPLFRFVATPAATSGLIVIPSAKNGPVLGINPAGAKGNITGSKNNLIWRLGKNTPDVPSPLIHDGLVYLCRENGQLLCVDAKTGEVIYKKRAYKKRHRSSPVYADGKVYLVAMDGTVTVVKAGREFQILSQNRMAERTAASLAISNGTIYMRTYKALYAISE